MDYQYFKHRPLNEDEHKRLQLSNEIHSLLPSIPSIANGESVTEIDIADRSGNHLVREILAFLTFPGAIISKSVTDWMLSYSSKPTLEKLIAVLADDRPIPKQLKTFSSANPEKLLNSERITPDYQYIQNSIDPKTALVCFTCDNQRLNVPLQLLNTVVCDSFDIVMYLRDDRRQRFTHGIPEMGNNLEELGETIRNTIPDDCHIAVLSASSGGLAASRISDALNADRVALFSPIFHFKDELAVTNTMAFRPENTRIYFAANQGFDKILARQWRTSHLGATIELLDSETHGTLSELILSGQSNSLLNWLTGKDSSLTKLGDSGTKSTGS